MNANAAINTLTGAAGYSGTYWRDANINSNDFVSNLTCVGDYYSAKSALDYGVTLNEDAIKDIVEKLTKSKEIAKITPDEGPEIPKWTGFLPI